MRSQLTSFVAVASLLFACKALAGESDASEPSRLTGAVTEAAREKRPGTPRVRPVRERPAAQTSEPVRTSPPDRSAHAADVVSPPAEPAQDDSAVCCCRYFAQGWQHAWRSENSCSSSGGACVAHDRCRS
jgi:hypothetical protein